MNRKKSREVAMELLFENTIKKESLNELIEGFKENTDYDLSEIDLEYVTSTIKGIYDNLEVLDKTIEEYLVSWKMNRISKVNLSILRLGTYELMINEDIPNKVAINEAVELTKKYSDETSVKFINGVLDKILKKDN